MLHLSKCQDAITTVKYNFGNILFMEFNEWLDEELKRKGWSRSKLAKMSGFSEAAISLIHTGKRKPGIEVCQAIAKALNLSVETVYSHAGLLPNKPSNDADFTQLKHIFLQMTEEDQEEFLELGRMRLELKRRRQIKDQQAETG
jgi:transcriptional regulator with XRE-family HTH domain